MVEIREIDADELRGWVAAMREGHPDTGTVDDYLDWKRQARETIWLLASDGSACGAAIGIGGWHSPLGVARGEVRVVPWRRGGGIGDALLTHLAGWATTLGYHELMGSVQEDDPGSLDWAERRGFVEVGRNSLLALELGAVEAPEVAPPPGVEIVTWAERPEVVRGMYAVACEAYPDVPGEEDSQMASFQEWLSQDLQGSADRPEATFAALASGEVVGYAKLSLSNARPGVAMHDMTGVLRAWRGRGIAGALKRAEIAWAKQAGFTRLETYNEDRNEPIRRLNERHGYRPAPGSIVVRGPVPG
jgi:GNAT superfamily N-acetyltransferase